MYSLTTGGASGPAVSSMAYRQLSAADVADAELDADDSEDARMHRLQRQDAKSRKTFKIKRNRSTVRATAAVTVARSATVKVGGHATALDWAVQAR